MVPNTTRFAERARLSLREELLDAAAHLLPERGFGKLRMADVAGEAGVSRQTVYNEFGGKEALVSAVALRVEVRFLEEAERRMRLGGHLLEGVRDGVTWVIGHANEDPLVASALGAGDAADLLPFLTGRQATPLLESSRALFESLFAERTDLSAAAAGRLAEQVHRLVVSHIAMPTETPAEAARDIAELIAPHIT